MSKTGCMPTKAKISRKLACRAREALEGDYEIRAPSGEPAPALVLQERKANSDEGEEDDKEDAVEEAKRKFEEAFNLYDLNIDDLDDGETPPRLLWGKPAVFQHYIKTEILRTAPGAYHGLLVLSDNCDLPGGHRESGNPGQGYYWDAEMPVVWECKGGGYCISFAFAKS